MMPDAVSHLIAGHERHLLAQMIADDEMQEVGLDGHIGPYRLAECLGEGGFGFVWRAEQTEPVRREVALKVLKRGMDTAQVLGRFSLEQQALASMEHPHIAALLDAGATPDGRPFFVMELVRGPSLTTYCREKKLPWQERVALFKNVCGGVLHAHQKGMIHRDLKPSNILVAEVDGKPVPKIIDFGIAKAMTEGLVQEAFFTRAGHVMGTPHYMSPEQLSGSRDIDVRSDVYALGVLFYQMLTDSLPYESLVRESTTHADMLRILNDSRPVRPSVQITETVKMAALKQKGSPPPAHHISGIPVDLDWIILKALEQERDRRYDSVGALIADVERFQNNEPVLARPPSFRYHAGRWARRNRITFAAACVSLAAIIGGAGVALWQAHEARVSQKLAESESTRAGQVVTFLTSMLDRVAEEIAHGRNPEALKLALEGCEQQIRQLDFDPSLQADLFYRVGWLYSTMGERKLALPLLESHAELLGRIHGVDSQIAWDAELGHIVEVVAFGARMQAPAMIEELLQRVAAKGQRGSDFWFRVQEQKIVALRKLHRSAEARAAAESALAESRLHALPVRTVMLLKGACVDALQEASDYAAAESLVNECLEFCDQDPGLALSRGWMEGKLLYIQRAKGDHARGAEILREKVAHMKKASGECHRDLIAPLIMQSEFERDAKLYDAAISHAQEALAIARANTPSASALKGGESIETLRSDLVNSLRILADCESQAGRHQDAIRDAREAFRIADEQGNNVLIDKSLLILAMAQEKSKELDGAYESYRLRQRLSGQHGANYQRWHEDLESMCAIRQKQGRVEEAMTLAQELWDKVSAMPEAQADAGHMADTAKIALRCQEALLKAHPDTPPPPNLALWKETIAKAR